MKKNFIDSFLKLNIIEINGKIKKATKDIKKLQFIKNFIPYKIFLYLFKNKIKKYKLLKKELDNRKKEIINLLKELKKINFQNKEQEIKLKILEKQYKINNEFIEEQLKITLDNINKFLNDIYSVILS